MVTIRATNPILCVSDVEASIRYYVEKLGFAVTFSWGEDDGPVTFAGVQRDGFEVMLCRDGQGHPGAWFTVWVDDVDALHDEYVVSGADVRRAPVDLPWGVREMNVADPDGNRIRVSTSTGRHAPPVDDPFGPA